MDASVSAVSSFFTGWVYCLGLQQSMACVDLERAAEPWLAHEGVRRVPYLEERDFWLAETDLDAALTGAR